MKTLMFSLLLLPLIINILSTEDVQSSKCGTVEVKSCENKQHVKDENVNGGGTLVKISVNLKNVRQKRSQSFKSTSVGNRRSSESLKADLMQKIQKQQEKMLLESDQRTQRELSSMKSNESRTPEEHRLTQQQVFANRIEQLRQRNQRRRDRTTLTQSQYTASRQNNPSLSNIVTDRYRPQDTSPKDTFHSMESTKQTKQEEARTSSINYSSLKQSYNINPDSKHARMTNFRPSFKSLENGMAKKSGDPPRKSHGRSSEMFVTESTSIDPFIPTTQALNYLTSYDSLRLPTRWPIKMILPEKEQRTMQQEKSEVFNRNEQNNEMQAQNTNAQESNTESSRTSSIRNNLSHSINKNKQKDDVKTNQNKKMVHDRNGEQMITSESIEADTLKDTDVNDLDRSQVEADNLNDVQTQDDKLHLQNTGQDTKETQTKKKKKSKKNKRDRQQQRRRNKQLKRQRKRRKERKRGKKNKATSITTALYDTTSDSSLIASLDAGSNLKYNLRKNKSAKMILKKRLLHLN